MSLVDDLLAELEGNPEKAERLIRSLTALVDPDRRFTAAEMAERWSANPRTVERWCRDGRIPTAEKVGHRWLMPADAKVDPKRRKDLGPARANQSRGLAAGDRSGQAALDALKPARKGRAA